MTLWLRAEIRTSWPRKASTTADWSSYDGTLTVLTPDGNDELFEDESSRTKTVIADFGKSVARMADSI